MEKYYIPKIKLDLQQTYQKHFIKNVSISQT